MTNQTKQGIYPIGRCNHCMIYFHKNDRTDNEGICRNCGKSDGLMDMPELAAAPELLEAFKEVLIKFEKQGLHEGYADIYQNAMKAISKATGKE